MFSLPRREVIRLLGSAAAASALSPLAARAQEVKRVGVLMPGTGIDTISKSHLDLFVQGLRRLGWIEGATVHIEVRWNGGDPGRTEAYATDLVGLFRPHVLMAVTSVNLIALKRATSTIPIVFAQVRDPVEQGLVQNLTHPGGNITGFANSEFSIAGKWADLLKQMVPTIRRIAVLFDPDSTPQSSFYFSALQAAAPSLGVEFSSTPIRNPAEVESTLARLSREANTGLMFLPVISHSRTLILETVARYRLPAIHASAEDIREGALMHYGNVLSEQFRQAPYYVDRILRGTRPGELAVQLPTKFRFVVNRKTAAALGIEVPLGLLLAADEVIE